MFCRSESSSAFSSSFCGIIFFLCFAMSALKIHFLLSSDSKLVNSLALVRSYTTTPFGVTLRTTLAVIWPWKYSYDTVGNLVEANKFGALVNTDVKIISYERILPHIDGLFFIPNEEELVWK